MTLVNPSEVHLAKQKEILQKAILPDWGKRCGKACSEKFNQTIGKILSISIDASKL